MNTVQIGGNTYNCRDMIKGRGGKWDATSKTWTISTDAWTILSALDNGRATRGCHIVGGKPVAPAAYRKAINQPCRKCGSYCYGDCEA